MIKFKNTNSVCIFVNKIKINKKYVYQKVVKEQIKDKLCLYIVKQLRDSLNINILS